MNTFDDRKKAFESKYATDAEMQFKVMAKRNKFVGLWAANLLGMPKRLAAQSPTNLFRFAITLNCISASVAYFDSNAFFLSSKVFILAS